MLIADLRPILKNRFVQVYDEFVTLCARDFQTASFLSNLFGWSESADNEPKKHGWVYKTAKHLKEELGLSRRGYEKARKKLLELGVLQYRRGGVHGKMHWYINREVLLIKICELRGIEVPEVTKRHHFDRDNFRLPKFIPLDLWHAYLDMRQEKGNKAGNSAKKAAVKQLAELHNRNLDLRPIMDKTILMGWAGFFHNDKKPNRPGQPSEKDLNEQHARTLRELAAAAAEREKQAKPPDKPPGQSDGNYGTFKSLGQLLDKKIKK
ncbi:hypothetical protein [Neisseria sp.]|uniref:hypothetical protein n=1 Tax=Neisseria sp. TaxID=192066 RepID=UPI0035A169F6